MAVISIDIVAMQALIDALDKAKRTKPEVADRLKWRLSAVDLGVGALNRWKTGGTVWAQVDDWLKELRRRLLLAQMLDQRKPSPFHVVWFLRSSPRA